MELIRQSYQLFLVDHLPKHFLVDYLQHSINSRWNLPNILVFTSADLILLNGLSTNVWQDCDTVRSFNQVPVSLAEKIKRERKSNERENQTRKSQTRKNQTSDGQMATQTYLTNSLISSPFFWTSCLSFLWTSCSSVWEKFWKRCWTSLTCILDPRIFPPRNFSTQEFFHPRIFPPGGSWGSADERQTDVLVLLPVYHVFYSWSRFRLFQVEQEKGKILCSTGAK